jgi:hypothetical protein
MRSYGKNDGYSSDPLGQTKIKEFDDLLNLHNLPANAHELAYKDKEL